MDYPSQYGWGGQRRDRTRTTHYSRSTVVGHVVLIGRLVFKRSWTINPGQRMTSCWVCTKNLCFSTDALIREPAMLRRWAWILHLLILNGGNGLELAYNRGLGILLSRISLGCKLQSWTSLGTVVQFERFLTPAKFISAGYLHCTSPPHGQCRNRQGTISLIFQHCIEWGRGRRYGIFKMIALLFRTVVVIHIELLLCSYCLKDFCPGLQTPLFANSIPHFAYLL